jgi:murein DD-endopeptidase MepM/ murein hydrolase activator NlpD
MPGVVELLCSRRVPQVAVLALMSIGFAGCSADMSSRFSQDPFSNPFAAQQEATGSVPTAAVEHRELPQNSRPQSSYQSAALPPPVAPARPLPPPTAGVSGGGRGVASYSPPPPHPLETTGTVAPRSVAAVHAAGQGPTKIIVGTSDTLEILARRYNVSTAAIMQANGYKGPRALSPGQQLIIPRQTAAIAAPATAAPATRSIAAATPTVHVVNRGDTLLGIAHRNHIPVAELAKANRLAPTAPLKLGMKLTVPGAKIAAAAPTAPASPPPATAAPAMAANRVAAAVPESQQKARLAQATTTPEELSGPSSAKTAEATGALPSFRWPVRGRVITAYGAKTNGKANDGINLAVPEGTPIKAAEDGVVAYSGNELKGYGNLVLIRHANGYVTAYAHASQLLVKRGDTIKRGQVIAKSGQSGEVASPQLHFEIRKGSSPVDPLQFLSGA